MAQCTTAARQLVTSPVAVQNQSGLLQRAVQRQAAAQRILNQLDLLGRWARYGRPMVVGSVAYDLVVEPDIDLEIYAAQPQIEDGFAVVSSLALVPGVWKVRFSNELAGPDSGLYWQLRYRDPASTPGQPPEVWKIDMWLLADDYAGPRAAALVEPMRRVLTPETRAAILQIKEAYLGHETVHGINVYRAVLDGGVYTPEAYEQWISEHGPMGLTAWRPAEPSPGHPSTPGPLSSPGHPECNEGSVPLADAGGDVDRIPDCARNDRGTALPGHAEAICRSISLVT